MRLGIHFLCPFFLFASSVILGMAVSLVSYSSFSFFLLPFWLLSLFLLTSFCFFSNIQKNNNKKSIDSHPYSPSNVSLSLSPSLPLSHSLLCHTLSHTLSLSHSHMLCSAPSLEIKPHNATFVHACPVFLKDAQKHSPSAHVRFARKRQRRAHQMPAVARMLHNPTRVFSVLFVRERCRQERATSVCI